MLYTFWFHNLVLNHQLLPRAVNKCSLNYLTFSVEQKNPVTCGNGWTEGVTFNLFNLFTFFF